MIEGVKKGNHIDFSTVRVKVCNYFLMTLVDTSAGQFVAAQCMVYNGYSTLLASIGYSLSHVVPNLHSLNVYPPSCMLMSKNDENLLAAQDSTHRRRAMECSRVEMRKTPPELHF